MTRARRLTCDPWTAKPCTRRRFFFFFSHNNLERGYGDDKTRCGFVKARGVGIIYCRNGLPETYFSSRNDWTNFFSHVFVFFVFSFFFLQFFHAINTVWRWLLSTTPCFWSRHSCPRRSACITGSRAANKKRHK